MPYTVWCDDRLVGESNLDYIANTDQHMMGDFAATEYGEQIIPILMAPRQALVAHDYARLEETQKRRDQVRLTLRGPDGRAIPVHHIEITDTEWLLTLSNSISEDWETDCAIAESESSEELTPGDDDLLERFEADPPPWMDDESDVAFDEEDWSGDGYLEPRPFPRYQVQVLFRA